MTTAPVRAATVAVVFALAFVGGACGSDSSPDANRTAPTSLPAGGATGSGTQADPGPGPTSIPAVALKLHQVASVDTPVDLTARSGTDDLYIAEQGGRVRRLQVKRSTDSKTNVITKTIGSVDPGSVLDLTDEISSGGERGLLGVTFSSDGRKLYAYYTDTVGDIHVVEFPMDGDKADTRNRRELLFVEHHTFANHNGGRLVFGPDGYLYVGLGDGGSSGDPNGNGQNTQALLGKILRIDPEAPTADKPYGIPAGNPFADGRDGAPEVWLYGVRNPWRFSFDHADGDLWIGDVGQDRIEEVDQLPSFLGRDAGKGANLGWNEMEGSKPYQGGTAPDGAVAPVFDYTHAGGNCSVTGGFVYRGAAIPDLQGVYVFADYCVGDIRGLLARRSVRLDERSLGVAVDGGQLTSFGEDADGELYVLSAAGAVSRIEPA
ncbi:MAG: PQQ-dependent sugar dehydrogenase [Acidimicrobiales bacterium]